MEQQETINIPEVQIVPEEQSNAGQQIKSANKNKRRINYTITAREEIILAFTAIVGARNRSKFIENMMIDVCNANGHSFVKKE